MSALLHVQRVFSQAHAQLARNDVLSQARTASSDSWRLFGFCFKYLYKGRIVSARCGTKQL